MSPPHVGKGKSSKTTPMGILTFGNHCFPNGWNLSFSKVKTLSLKLFYKKKRISIERVLVFPICENNEVYPGQENNSYLVKNCTEIPSIMLSMIDNRFVARLHLG